MEYFCEKAAFMMFNLKDLRPDIKVLYIFIALSFVVALIQILLNE